MIAKTSHGYIHEFSLFDDMLASIEESATITNEGFSEFEREAHSAEMRMMFESNDSFIYEADNKKAAARKATMKKKPGIFARIGTAIIELINKIKKFISDIAGKIFGFNKQNKEDKAKVDHIIAKNPQLRGRILDGIDRNWFTMADIAKFEKDSMGLIRMLDAKTVKLGDFEEKWKIHVRRFNDSFKPLATSAITITTLVGFGPKICKAMGDAKTALNSLTGDLATYHDKVNEYISEDELPKSKAKMKAFQEVAGVHVKFMKQMSEKQTLLSKLTDKWLAKGDATKQAELMNKGGFRGKAVAKHVQREKNVADKLKQYKDEHDALQAKVLDLKDDIDTVRKDPLHSNRTIVSRQKEIDETQKKIAELEKKINHLEGN